MTRTMDQAIAKTTSPTTERCPLRALMAFDSERLLERFDEFVAALEADARAHALEVWQGFAGRLRQRMVQEEQLLLPTFAAAQPLEAQLLKNEHEQLRRELRRLGSRLELHCLRAEHAREFFRLLRRHVHGKDAVYSWAERQLSSSARAQLLHALRDTEGPSPAGMAFESGSFQAYK